jgi:5'(3')-deoxyribonucleotidase
MTGTETKTISEILREVDFNIDINAHKLGESNLRLLADAFKLQIQTAKADKDKPKEEQTQWITLRNGNIELTFFK